MDFEEDVTIPYDPFWSPLVYETLTIRDKTEFVLRNTSQIVGIPNEDEKVYYHKFLEYRASENLIQRYSDVIADKSSQIDQKYKEGEDYSNRTDMHIANTNVRMLSKQNRTSERCVPGPQNTNSQFGFIDSDSNRIIQECLRELSPHDTGDVQDSKTYSSFLQHIDPVSQQYTSVQPPSQQQQHQQQYNIFQQQPQHQPKYQQQQQPQYQPQQYQQQQQQQQQFQQQQHTQQYQQQQTQQYRQQQPQQYQQQQPQQYQQQQPQQYQQQQQPQQYQQQQPQQYQQQQQPQQYQQQQQQQPQQYQQQQEQQPQQYQQQQEQQPQQYQRQLQQYQQQQPQQHQHHRNNQHHQQLPHQQKYTPSTQSNHKKGYSVWVGNICNQSTKQEFVEFTSQQLEEIGLQNLKVDFVCRGLKCFAFIHTDNLEMQNNVFRKLQFQLYKNRELTVRINM